MLGLVAHLRVSEPKRREPGGKMVLVAATISGLLRGSSVVAQPIGLDDQPQVGPEEVDAIAAEVFARDGHRQSRLRHEWQEEPLEFGVGEPKRAPVEQLPQPRNAPAPSVSLKLSAKRLRINEIEPIRLVHRPLEAGIVHASKVNQS